MKDYENKKLTEEEIAKRQVGISPLILDWWDTNKNVRTQNKLTNANDPSEVTYNHFLCCSYLVLGYNSGIQKFVVECRVNKVVKIWNHELRGSKIWDYIDTYDYMNMIEALGLQHLTKKPKPNAYYH